MWRKYGDNRILREKETSDWGFFGELRNLSENWGCRSVTLELVGLDGLLGQKVIVIIIVVINHVVAMCHFGIGWRDYLGRRTLHLEKKAPFPHCGTLITSI